MSRSDYLKEVESLLQDISPHKRELAIKYYNEYIEKAGPDMEEKTMEELGPPAKLAFLIKAKIENAKKTKESESSESEEMHGEESAIQPMAGEMLDSGSQNKLIFWFLIIIFAIPIGVPALCIICAASIGIILALVGVFALALIGSIVIACSGGICMITGVGQMLKSVPQGIYEMGMGILLLGVGILLGCFSVWLCTRVLPTFVFWLLDMLRKPFVKESEVQEWVS